MRLSERAHFEGGPNALTRALAARREAGLPVLDLTLANPTRAGLPYERDRILRALSDARALDYAPEPFGLRDARQVVASHLSAHGSRVDPARVVLTASTSEAYSFLLQALTDPGDEVLVPAPGYPLLAQLAAFSGVTLCHYALGFDDAFHFDALSAYESISERTRAMLVISPDNPSGACLDADARDALAELGIPIIADEVFADYPLEPPPGRVTCAASLASGSIISLGGLSKSAALPQMKLAWMVVGGPDELALPLLERLEVIADTFLSLATPVQLALPELLSAGETTRDAIRARTRRNLEALRGATQDTALEVPRVGGGWYACVRLPATKTDEEHALAALACGVLVHPGYLFDFPDDATWLVVSLLTPESEFDAGVASLIASIT